MSKAELHDYLENMAERLDEITAALLSGQPGARTALMAERQHLLAEVARTSDQLERPSTTPLLRPKAALAQSLRLIKG